MTENKFVFVDIDDSASEHIAAPHYSYWKSVARKFFSSRVAIGVLVLVTIVILMSAFHPMISGHTASYTPNINDFTKHYLRPSFEHWFGTDNVGNSLFDTVWLGTRTSLSIAFIATIITTVLGVIVGAFWGYSKKIDKVMIEIYNVVANVPFTLLIIILMYVIGRGYWQLIFSLSVTTWLSTAYFIRIQVMIIRDREYNLASRCLGTPTPRVIQHNILPFLISIIVTAVARDVPMFISYEVFLSYLGIGLGAKVVSLGQMIRDYSAYMNSTPYMFWIPVSISAIIAVSLYIVGQTLADAADPRTHM